MDPKKLNIQSGYLLMDVVIAIFIIGTALLAISGMFIKSTQANIASANITAATTLGQRQMELLKTKPDSFWTDLNLPAVILWQGKDEERTVNKVTFTVATTASTSTLDSNLAEVTVVITWQEFKSERSLQFVSLFKRSL